jgi:hypothetical protein
VRIDAGGDDMIDVFGWELTAAFVAIGIAYSAVALAPVWWPAWRAWRGSPPLPRPFLFVGVAAALVYGVSTFILLAIFLPMSAIRIFIVPSLDHAGVWYGTPLGHVSHLFYEHGWLLIVPVELLLAWYVTRRLERRWGHIVSRPAADEPA